jgi:DNA-binding IclR family transcriptional regulator
MDVVTTPQGQPPAYPIASVDNALRLLRMLGSRDELTLSEVSQELEVAPSTAHRLLAMLRYHDFVRQDPASKAYRPGRALLEIAVSATGGVDVRAVAQPELEALSRAVDETVHLVSLDGDRVLFLASVESRRIVRVTSRAGVTMPAHCTAAGKIMLAQLPEEEQLAGLEPGALEGMTERSRTTADALRRDLRAARKAGFATNFGESEDGLAAVAVAVPAPRVHGPLSITVSAPSARLDRRSAPDVAATARRAAERIGERLARSGS